MGLSQIKNECLNLIQCSSILCELFPKNVLESAQENVSSFEQLQKTLQLYSQKSSSLVLLVFVSISVHTDSKKGELTVSRRCAVLCLLVVTQRGK